MGRYNYFYIDRTTDDGIWQTLDEKHNRMAVITDFKIGYAFSDQFMLYWKSSVSWFNTVTYATSDQTVEVFDSVVTTPSGDTTAHHTEPVIVLETDEDGATMAVGVGGIGASYFFKPQAPSLFVSATVGFTSQSYPFWGSEPHVGFGLAGGIGYEFSPNWNVELTFLTGTPKGDTEQRPVTYEASTVAFGLTINVLGY
jgi:hypothetical protein